MNICLCIKEELCFQPVGSFVSVFHLVEVSLVFTVFVKTVSEILICWLVVGMVQTDVCLFFVVVFSHN